MEETTTQDTSEGRDAVGEAPTARVLSPWDWAAACWLGIPLDAAANALATPAPQGAEGEG